MGPRTRPAVLDEQVHFPDARIEYQDVDGDIRHVDIEITTEHYRGAHGTHEPCWRSLQVVKAARLPSALRGLDPRHPLRRSRRLSERRRSLPT